MAGLRLGQKVVRVIQLLLGLRHRRIVAALGHHGFTQDDLDRGWKVLRGAVGERIDIVPVSRPDPEALERLDDWENKWFPITSATLTHNHPKVHEQVFLNLSQTQGPELVVSVGTFLKRIAALEQGEGEGAVARKLLARRGLTADTIGEAKKLLERIGTVQEPPAGDLEGIRAAQQRAEDAMWAWYIEWSAIARTAIKDGRLLRILGFRRGRPSGGSALEIEDATQAEGPEAEEPGEPGSTPETG